MYETRPLEYTALLITAWLSTAFDFCYTAISSLLGVIVPSSPMAMGSSHHINRTTYLLQRIGRRIDTAIVESGGFEVPIMHCGQVPLLLHTAR